MLGAVACSKDARTSSDAPNATNNNTAQTEENSRIRQAQLESDRRAREQREINNNNPSGGVREAQIESDKRAGDQRSINDNKSEQPASNAEQNTANDATSNVRQRQIESDQRALDQRDNITGNPQEKTDGDLESLVRDNLETSLPTSKLTIDSESGIVTISGTVSSQEELDRIESLAKQVQGVKGVNVKATIEQVNP